MFFLFKQKTAYEMRISDWSSDVCSSDLRSEAVAVQQDDVAGRAEAAKIDVRSAAVAVVDRRTDVGDHAGQFAQNFFGDVRLLQLDRVGGRDVNRRRLFEVGVDRKSTRLHSSH